MRIASLQCAFGRLFTVAVQPHNISPFDRQWIKRVASRTIDNIVHLQFVNPGPMV